MAVEGDGASNSEKWMEEGYGARQGVRERLIKAGGVGEGEPWLLLAMFGHTSITLYLIVNLLIYSIKMICTKNNHRWDKIYIVSQIAYWVEVNSWIGGCLR